jgi:hypothetical protein
MIKYHELAIDHSNGDAIRRQHEMLGHSTVGEGEEGSCTTMAVVT